MSAMAKRTVFNEIDQAANLVWKLECGMYDAGLLQKNVQSFPAMHQTLLDISSSDAIEGAYALSVFRVQDFDLLYFFESGSFVGLTHNVCVGLLQTAGIIGVQPLLYRVYSMEDITDRTKYLQQRACSMSEKRRGSSKPVPAKSRSSKVYSRKLRQLQSQLRNIADVMAQQKHGGDTRCRMAVVHIVKKNAKHDKSDHRMCCGYLSSSSSSDSSCHYVTILSGRSTGRVFCPTCLRNCILDIVCAKQCPVWLCGLPFTVCTYTEGAQLFPLHRLGSCDLLLCRSCRGLLSLMDKVSDSPVATYLVCHISVIIDCNIFINELIDID